MWTLEPSFATEPVNGEVFSVSFSPNDAFLAAGCGRGTVCIYNVSTHQEALRLNTTGTSPMKEVRWRPEREDSTGRERGLLVGASTDGVLRQWHVPSGRLLHELGNAEETRQLFSVDYTSDGRHIVAGGMQELWAFDEETKKQVACLQGGDGVTTSGHSSRVFAVRGHPSIDQPSIVLSSGWDSAVQFWDLRAGTTAVRAIYGPHVCGPALDISADGSTILTGSCRPEEQLELWDFASGKRKEVIPWRQEGIQEPACLLYSACFSRAQRGPLIAAGGSSGGVRGLAEGEAKVIERSGGDSGERRCACTLTKFNCLSSTFSSENAGLVAFGGSDGRIRVLRVARAAAGA